MRPVSSRVSSGESVSPLVRGGIVLLGFAMAFGSLLSVCFDAYQPVQEPLEWGTAGWIGAGKPAASGYFRRYLQLAVPPQRATLLVSGTDDVRVNVNGRIAGSSSFFGQRTTTVLDVTRLLRAGKNVVAIQVDNQSRGKEPALAAFLAVYDRAGQRRVLVSDDSWRVETRELHQRAGNIDWTELNFPDLDWPHAVFLGPVERWSTMSPQVPESVYRTTSKSQWIWKPDNGETATFVREFDIDGGRIRHGWLGIALGGNYSLVVNDQILRFATGSERTIELYDIAPYLRIGRNRLLVYACADHGSRRLLITGEVTTAHGGSRLQSDRHWRTLGPDSVAELPVSLWGNADSRGPLDVAVREIRNDKGLISDRGWHVLGFATAVLLFSLLVFPLWHRLAGYGLFDSDRRAFLYYTHPYLWGLAASLAALVLGYDNRVDAGALWRPSVTLLIALSVLGWAALLLGRAPWTGGTDG